ncbi:hypothetical protein [Streptomyces sp. 8N616]|uniref:hypothetical protein n=1 Tax=Streptomyces sp. 8N616 TaxID=3457414 RepID=UPI003FD492A4
MRSRLLSLRSLPLLSLIMAAVFVLPTPLSASAAAAPVPDARSGTARQGEACGEFRVTGALPAPPAGMAVRQEVSVGDDCKPHLGPVRFVPAPDGRRKTAADRRELRTWSEMYDCCGILMTALYTTSTWENVDSKVRDVNTTARHDWNREPWDGGWSLAGTSQTGGCPGTCPGASAAAHAEFGYRGIFDLTGDWYANTHDSAVQLKGDGTASCRLDVTLRHTFIGWHWVRGCA